MKTSELAARHGMTIQQIEELRRAVSGYFIVRKNDEQPEVYPNRVVNTGLNYLLSSGLAAGTQITAWKVAAVKTNTTPAASMTYAVPVYSEITATDVSETVRQAWTAGSVSGQSVSNATTGATYTAAHTVTIYGAALVGGGTGATGLADAAGGGTMYSMSLFGTSKPLASSDTVTITYTLTQANATG